MNAAGLHTHVDAADLVRLVDGELHEPEARAIQLALEACEVCRDNELRIRRRAAGLALLLTDCDPAAPPAAVALTAIRAAAEARPARQALPGAWRPRRGGTGDSRSRLWLAAGIALVVLGSVLFSTPAAAWLARAAERVWSAVTPGTPPLPAPGPVSAPVVERVYEYVPDAGVLALTFPAGSAGVLRLDTVQSATLRLAAAGTAAPEVLLMPSQVRVGAGIGATGDFFIAVPRQVEAVRITVGDGAPVLLSRDRVAGGITVDLR